MAFLLPVNDESYPRGSTFTSSWPEMSLCSFTGEWWFLAQNTLVLLRSGPGRP